MPKEGPVDGLPEGVTFLAQDVVLFLHDQALREYGGRHGVRDEALLEAALARPRHRVVYGDDGRALDLFDVAAAYAFGLARNHAFVDGNKRTAWSCCVLFLKLHRIEIAVPVPEIVETMVGLAEGVREEKDFAVWLRRSRA